MSIDTKKLDMATIGKERLCGFCTAIRELLVKQNIKFDLIVAVGNSGLSVGKFTEFIYDHYKLKTPPKLSIPFYRFLPEHEQDFNKLFDSNYFLNEITGKLKEIGEIKNVLFVDDEIGRGVTATSLFNLINDVLEKLGRPKIGNYYIVAEDQGFKPPQDIPEIKFVPSALETEGHSNVIFYTTPNEFEQPIVKVLGDDDKFAFHKRTNLLLELPVKDFNSGKPVYTYNYLDLVKEKIPNFNKLQEEYQKYIIGQIKSCLES